MTTHPDSPSALTYTPTGCAGWLADLKARIHTAQQLAALEVTRELVLLYWQIVRDILERQGWGAKVIERLAHDLRIAFPEMKGFSPRNLKYCAPLPRLGRTANLCKGCLHNCSGTISSRCSTSCARRMSAVGMPPRRSKTTDRVMFW